MKTHNTGSAKIETLRGRSLDDENWLRWATLLLFGTALAIGLLSVPAHAEEAMPPSRIANIYGGFHHQPTRAQIESRERAAGLAASTRHQSSEDAALQQLYQQLKENAGTG
jgi:hypothetical protein